MGKNDVTQEAIKAAQREYFRAWRARNKDKVRKHNQNYWAKKAAERAAAATQTEGDASGKTQD